LLASAASTDAFDLQGHRGARGLAPENSIKAFTTALAIGVSTLELDLAMTKDGILVVSHDSALNPDHTRGPDGKFLANPGPAIRTLTLAEVKQYDVGRLKPGTAYAARFPEQRPVDGARIPTLAEVFELAKPAEHVRFNIETKLTPTNAGTETPDPTTFAQAVADAVRAAGLTTRVTVQSFDWRSLVALRRIVPEIERVCLTIETIVEDTIERSKRGPSAWTAGFDLNTYGGSVPKLAAAAGCHTWSPYFGNVTPGSLADAKQAGVKVIPWTVNEPADMARLIDMGVDGLISDYPDRLRTIVAARGGLPLPPPIANP
jgi:glycerophosphoryl diester phosphodiesterase